MHSPKQLPGHIGRPLMAHWQWLPLLAVLALSGCQMRDKERPLSSEAPPPPVFASNLPVTCRADKADYAVGQTITNPLLEQIRVRTGASVVRKVSTTDLVTATGARDADDGRLTVNVDPDGRMVTAHCG
jgi:hypothetical protein